MWTENRKRSDANCVVWINLIQSNTIHCTKLGLMRAQKSYFYVSSAQVTTPGLFGGFSFRGLKKLKGGDSWIHSTAQRKDGRCSISQVYPHTRRVCICMSLFYFLSLLNLFYWCVSVSDDPGKVDLPTAFFCCSLNVVVLMSPPLTKYFQ